MALPGPASGELVDAIALHAKIWLDLIMSWSELQALQAARLLWYYVPHATSRMLYNRARA